MLHVETFTFLPQAFAENTYVVWDDSLHGVIIDPGCYLSHEQRQLTEFIADKGLTIDYILLTHAHLDHVFGLNHVHKTYPVPIVAHREEVFNFDRGPQHAGQFGFSLEELDRPDIWVDAGDTIEFGETTFTVLFTPGHSPGHVAFYRAASHQLFSGDVIFQNSFGRTDLPGGSMEVLRETILNTVLTLPEETVIYPGHMGTTTVGREKRTNPMVTGF